MVARHHILSGGHVLHGPDENLNTRKTAGDRLTIVSIALIAYMVGSVVHEAAGHGGACIASGGTPLLVSTVAMDCSIDNRLIDAGGTIANVVAAITFFLIGRLRRFSPTWRYLLWISMTINILSAAGYFLFSGIGGFGDWADFIRGLPRVWAWRTGMSIFGLFAYAVAVWASLLALRPLIGSDPHERYLRAKELTARSYLAGGILACIAGALNPSGWILVALSAAAASFGGTSGLVWGPQWLRGRLVSLGSEPAPPPIERNWKWVAAASVCACLFIAVDGPGIRFAPQ
jgi:hypothetical protein